MFNKYLLKSLIITIVFLGGAAVFNHDTWATGLEGGMGGPQELADQINNSNGGAGLNSSNTTNLEETLMQASNEYFLSHPEYGIGIEYDDGTVISPGGTTKPSSQNATQSQSAEPSKSNNKKTETGTKEESKKEEPKEEPEEEVHEHVYKDRVTKQPTCTEPGITTFSCECGGSYTEEIPATGHEPGEWETETEATCTTDGNKVVKCTKCGEILEEEVIPARGHSEGDWEVFKDATWTQTGQMITKCTVCGETINTKDIPANTTPLYVIGGCIAGAMIVCIIYTAKKRKKGKMATA